MPGAGRVVALRVIHDDLTKKTQIFFVNYRLVIVEENLVFEARKRTRRSGGIAVAVVIDNVQIKKPPGNEEMLGGFLQNRRESRSWGSISSYRRRRCGVPRVEDAARRASDRRAGIR